ELHVIVRPDPFTRVDHAPFEFGVDLSAWDKDRCAARLHVDLAAEARPYAHLEALEVADRVHLLPKPPRHLRSCRRGWARHEVEGCVRFFPEPQPIALVEPGQHTLGIHSERDGREPLHCRLLVSPVVRGRHERLDGAFRGRIEALERGHDLAARKDLDPEPSATDLLDYLRQSVGCALGHVRRRGPGRGHARLDLRLRDDVGGVDDGGGRDGRHRPACFRKEPTSLSHHTLLAEVLRLTESDTIQNPHTVALDAAIQLAAILVLLEEGGEVLKEHHFAFGRRGSMVSGRHRYVTRSMPFSPSRTWSLKAVAPYTVYPSLPRTVRISTRAASHSVIEW